MPLLRRQPFIKNTNDDLLSDNEEVYYCKPTKEMFKNYEDYFQRVMLINSMIWSCELTGRPDLTYSEALECEKNARKEIKSFPSELRIPMLIIANKTKRTSLKELLDDICGYVKERFFINETVTIKGAPKREARQRYKVIEIIKGDSKNANTIKYKVQHIVEQNQSMNSKQIEPIQILSSESLNRPFDGTFNRERLKLYLKQYLEQTNGILRIKPADYTLFVEGNETNAWKNVFIGELPNFESSKRYNELKERNEKNNKKKSKKKTKPNNNNENKNKKQNISKVNGTPTANKNTKTNKVNGISTTTTKKPTNNTATEINVNGNVKQTSISNYLSKNSEAEREKQKQITALTYQTMREFNQTNQEDLELKDSRPLPTFKEVKTLIPLKYFGDFIMILEFMHSFADLLTIKDKFPEGISISILERALLLREHNGPLNDVLQVLLSTIFSLQLEEDGECEMNYINQTINDRELQKTYISEVEKAGLHATKAAKYPHKYYGTKLFDLPIDSNTISELLRLHLLSSGARTNDVSSRWRFQYRGGYNSNDDPGLTLRVKYPNIVKTLTTYSVFQLSLKDILKVILCLINQIKTYSSIREEIEERLGLSYKSKLGLKNFFTKLRRFKIETTAKRKEFVEEHKKELEEFQGSPAEKLKLKQDLDLALEERLRKYENQSEKTKIELTKELEEYKRDIFAFQIYLGSDRAYRNYWLFESLPGIFIEHDVTYSGKCLDKLTEIIPGLSEIPIQQRYNFAKNYVRVKHSNETELNKENTIESTLRLTKTSNIINNEYSIKIIKDLFMCTTDINNCPVHSLNYTNRVQWSYISTENEVDELFKSLNPLGIREGKLRDNLDLERELILDHISSCPIEKLSIDLNNKKEILDSMVKGMKKYSPTINCTDLNVSLEELARENLLDLYEKIESGCLGSVKVKDKYKFRKCIEIGDYVSNIDDLKIDVDNEDKFEDPGDVLNDIPVEVNSDSDDGSDDSISLFELTDMKKIVKSLAAILLQIKQGIELKYFKFPFAPKSGNKDYATVAERNTKNWEISLMSSKNFSQIFLHYNTLYDSIQWSKSADRAYCRLCRRRSNPEHMLLCDGCNGGFHMYCLKPKLKAIPEGDWFCSKCQPKDIEQTTMKRKRKVKVFKYDSDAETSDDQASENEEVKEKKSANDVEDKPNTDGINEKSVPCITCKIFTGDEMVECNTCNSLCHLECAVPPLRHIPRLWACHVCKKNKTLKESRIRKYRELSDDDEDDIENKKFRKSGNLKKRRQSKSPPVTKRKYVKKIKLNGDIDNIEDEDFEVVKLTKRQRSGELETTKTINNIRRSRQMDLPLHNVVLIDLLDDISKHEDAWPFNRPVSKYEVPDYYDIIKNPMDFAKIKSQLNVGYYKSDYDIMKDIQQIFANCDLYNTSDSDIYRAGIRLEKFVNAKCRELNLPFRPSDMISDDIHNGSTVVDETQEINEGKDLKPLTAE